MNFLFTGGTVYLLLVSDKNSKGHKSESQSQYLSGWDFNFQIQSPPDSEKG